MVDLFSAMCLHISALCYVYDDPYPLGNLQKCLSRFQLGILQNTDAQRFMKTAQYYAECIVFRVTSLALSGLNGWCAIF